MGSLLSPTGADITTDDLETKCIASLPFKLPFFFWYVDNIITAVPANEIHTIMNTFNSYNHKIQFRTEKESDGNFFFDYWWLNNNYPINFINNAINNSQPLVQKEHLHTATIWKQHKHSHIHTFHRSKP